MAGGGADSAGRNGEGLRGAAEGADSEGDGAGSVRVCSSTRHVGEGS